MQNSCLPAVDLDGNALLGSLLRWNLSWPSFLPPFRVTNCSEQLLCCTTADLGGAFMVHSAAITLLSVSESLIRRNSAMYGAVFFVTNAVNAQVRGGCYHTRNALRRSPWSKSIELSETISVHMYRLRNNHVSLGSLIEPKRLNSQRFLGIQAFAWADAGIRKHSPGWWLDAGAVYVCIDCYRGFPGILAT